MRATAQQPQRATGGAELHYERHRAEQTTLHLLVQQHVGSFIAHPQSITGAGLPLIINDEFDAFLACGILTHGLLGPRCGDFGHDKLLALPDRHRPSTQA